MWCWLARRVLLKIFYLLTCRVLSVAAMVFRSDLAKDAELLVLRHENAVLRRKVGRVRYEPADRAWFAALAGLVPSRRWAGLFPVTPGTLLAWHHRLAAGKYDSSKQRKPGRPPTRPSIGRLVVRLARESAVGAPADPRRHEARREGCAVYCAGDLACCGHRSSASPVRPDVAAVPGRWGTAGPPGGPGGRGSRGHGVAGRR